jgi:hypothetical protein
MIFSISNYDELIALHRVVMEAKFSIDPNDPAIQGSPLVAIIADQVIEALMNVEISKEGEASRIKWQRWREISPERREYQIIQDKIRAEALWKAWSFDEQADYIKILVSPLTISEELINELINSIN